MSQPGHEDDDDAFFEDMTALGAAAADASMARAIGDVDAQDAAEDKAGEIVDRYRR